MKATELMNSMFSDMHRAMRAEVEPLTDEQLLHRPGPNINSIAFVVWHYSRIEDDVIHSQAAGTKAIWGEERWYERLGLDVEASGMGFNDDQVGEFRPDRDQLLAYCDSVWAATPPLIEALSEADLDRPLNPERPRMTLGRSIANFALAHGFWHLGDIRFLKGMQGMRFPV